MQHSGLFIGLTTIDIQYFVDSFPGSNKKIKTQPPEILVGGPATNAAVAFAHLNGGAFLASAIGDNSFTRFINNDFELTNVHHFNLDKNPDTNAVLATVITSVENGDRNIFTHQPQPLKSIDLQFERLFAEVKPEIVMLDGFHPEIAIDVAKTARKQSIPVVLDCGSWKPQFEQLLNFCNIVICSEDFYPPGCNRAQDTMDYLHNKKIKQYAVTRGERGILFVDESYKGEIEIKKVPVADTLGAGDFLHGAFCFCFLKLNHFKHALIAASDIATETCRYPGTRKWLNFTK